MGTTTETQRTQRLHREASSRRALGLNRSGDSAGYFRSLDGLSSFALLACRQRITSIAECDTATERHQQRTTPNPSDERLVIHTHTPRACTHGFTKRYVQMAEESPKRPLHTCSKLRH